MTAAWDLETSVANIATDTTFDAKGDLIGGTGADTATRLAVGANSTVLMADSAETTGLKWASLYIPAVFDWAGNLSAVTGAYRWYNDTGRTLTIDSTRGSVGTAPLNQSILVDVNVNGTTIFTTQSNRITIVASGNTDQGGTPDVTTIANGQYITVDIDQVGTGTVGADLRVLVWLKG